LPPIGVTGKDEDKAYGSAIINFLQKDALGMIPFNPKGSKEDRANDEIARTFIEKIACRESVKGANGGKRKSHEFQFTSIVSVSSQNNGECV
jgi:hypothetical protein